MESSKLKVYVASTAAAFACAGATYAFLRHKYRPRNAVDAFKYLKIKTVNNEQTCDEVIEELRRSCKQHRAIGFDCEWVTENGRRQPVALLQLSSFDGLCGLFRLSHLETVPNSLKSLLEDESIYKVGVAPLGDANFLYQDYSVCLKSTLDIRHLAFACGRYAGGLESLSKDLLNVVLDKSWRIKCSDWAADGLTDRQIMYAAADAHVAVKIFEKLILERDRLHLSLYSKLKRSNVWERLDDICDCYKDMRFKGKANARQKNDSSKEESDLEGRKRRRNGKVEKYSNLLRTKPLYHNCFLQAPDGELLTTIDDKKAMWYVDKQLADVITPSPLTVRLRFEPAGRSVGDVGKYYQQTKENKCVVCGSTNSYIRKNVVPREYRKYFPEIMKEHSSHDVVLLCVSCHKWSNIRDQAVRERLAKQCGAPIRENSRFHEDEVSRKIRSAARALLKCNEGLPEERRKELKDILLQHYPEYDDVTDDLLKIAADAQIWYENESYECHGAKVVDHYLKNGGLLKLEQLWREHFLEAMRPKYLPYLWSVQHNEDRLKIKFQEGRLSEQDLKLVGITRWLSIDHIHIM